MGEVYADTNRLIGKCRLETGEMFLIIIAVKPGKILKTPQSNRAALRRLFSLRQFGDTAAHGNGLKHGASFHLYVLMRHNRTGQTGWNFRSLHSAV